MTTTRRPETGPMQFGDDWTGVFIRGDNAFAFAQALRASGDPTHPLVAASLEGLIELLESSNEANKSSETQRLLPWDQCCSKGER